MVIRPDKYKLAFQVAAVIVPLIMGIVGVVYGDPKPVIRDVCSTLLPGEVVAHPQPEDAGAPR